MQSKTTDVYELKTEKEVADFCEHLLQVKQVAPVSSKMTVAVTVHRNVKFRKQTKPRVVRAVL